MIVLLVRSDAASGGLPLSVAGVFECRSNESLDIFRRSSVFEEIDVLHDESPARFSRLDRLLRDPLDLVGRAFLEDIDLVDAAKDDVGVPGELFGLGQVGVTQRGGRERLNRPRAQFLVRLLIGKLIPDHRREHSREALVKQGVEGK